MYDDQTTPYPQATVALETVAAWMRGEARAKHRYGVWVRSLAMRRTFGVLTWMVGMAMVFAPSFRIEVPWWAVLLAGAVVAFTGIATAREAWRDTPKRVDGR